MADAHLPVNYKTRHADSIKLDDRSTLKIESLEGTVEGTEQTVYLVALTKTTKPKEKGGMDTTIGIIVDPDTLPAIIKALTAIKEQLVQT